MLLWVFYLGMRYKVKWMNPQILIVVTFSLNFLMNRTFRFGITGKILSNVALVGALYLGLKLQILAITGGIATGKSTVTKLL